MKFFKIKYILPFFLTCSAFAVFLSVSATAMPLGTSIGSVSESIGETFAMRAVGVVYKKNIGDFVGAGEVLATGKSSSMTVQFMDATTMTLGSEAEVTIDELIYDPDGNKNDNSLVISLAQGTYYYASGNIKKENITILTPTATIGIRGTELAIKIDGDGATSVGVVKGAAIMRARNRDRLIDRSNERSNDNAVFIDTGSTGRIEKSGEMSAPFGGIDLTGDDGVDRKIPGVAEWIDSEDFDEIELASNDNGRDGEIDDHLSGERDDEQQDEVFSDDEYSISDSEYHNSDISENDDSGDDGNNDG
ncbi:MAG: FecR domain-containing protein, partial [Rhodospirillaceae bacterium]|nr:FecR domain-containing protein [Rhodospirillaceae bacterium]